MLIESINNDKIKYYKKLRTTKYINEFKDFVVEGEHLVEEAIKSGYAKEIIILDGKNYTTNLPKIYVTEKVLKYISTLDSPQYVMALCYIKESNKLVGEKIVVLDNVSDPGNLGTIIRTSVAFGIDSIVISENSCSPYNDKVIRSSQGMIFKINIVECNLLDFIKSLKQNNIKVYGTDLKGSKLLNEIETPSSYALIFGNEGAGVRKEILDLCDEKILIEMSSNCESLNVGISAGIILYKWRNL